MLLLNIRLVNLRLVYMEAGRVVDGFEFAVFRALIVLCPSFLDT